MNGCIQKSLTGGIIVLRDFMGHVRLRTETPKLDFQQYDDENLNVNDMSFKSALDASFDDHDQN